MEELPELGEDPVVKKGGSLRREERDSEEEEDEEESLEEEAGEREWGGLGGLLLARRVEAPEWEVWVGV